MKTELLWLKQDWGGSWSSLRFPGYAVSKAIFLDIRSPRAVSETRISENQHPWRGPTNLHLQHGPTWWIQHLCSRGFSWVVQRKEKKKKQNKTGKHWSKTKTIHFINKALILHRDQNTCPRSQCWLGAKLFLEPRFLLCIQHLTVSLLSPGHKPVTVREYDVVRVLEIGWGCWWACFMDLVVIGMHNLKGDAWISRHFHSIENFYNCNLRVPKKWAETSVTVGI